MERYNIKSTPIEGLLIITPNELGLERNFLSESEGSADCLEQMGISDSFVERSCESFPRGVMKGLHFQRRDAQGRMIYATAGRALAVAVDLRPESKFFGAAHSVELKSQSEVIFYVPPYFALGFLTLEPATEIVTLATTPYDSASAAGIIYDDEILAIDWQFERYEIDERRLNISHKDRKLPSFRSYNQNTIWLNRPKKRRASLL